MSRETTFYVAASSRDRDRARHVMRSLEDLDWRCQFDWCAAMDEAGPNHALPVHEQAKFARADLAAVRRADVLVLVLGEALSEGAGTELGHALAFGHIEIVSVGRQPLFATLAHRHFDRVGDLLAWARVRSEAA